MSKQIAVRLSEDLVEFIDDQVASGAAGSRADAMTQALRRERRRQIAARDAEILAQAGSDGDLDALAEYAARVPLADLD